MTPSPSMLETEHVAELVQQHASAGPSARRRPACRCRLYQPQPAASTSIRIRRPDVTASWRAGQVDDPDRDAAPARARRAEPRPRARRRGAAACAPWPRVRPALAAPTRPTAGGRQAAPSLSMIVTMPVPSAIVAPPVGSERTTRNVSVGSAVRSPTIATVNVAVVCAGRERHRAALGLEVGAGDREAAADACDLSGDRDRDRRARRGRQRQRDRDVSRVPVALGRRSRPAP